MIAYLKGKLRIINPAKLIVEVNGVGYLVNVSINTFDEISTKEEAELFIHSHIREDAFQLFGFFTEQERDMFELLISVSGIGPKTALGILSGIKTAELAEAILNGNISRISASPGIGKKTAERLVLELKNKIDQITESSLSSQSSYGIRSEAIAALTTLGYNLKTAEKIVSEICEQVPNASLEEIIKEALRMMNR